MYTKAERITTLNYNEIFVFSNNLAGMHGGGAAKNSFLAFWHNSGARHRLAW